MRIVYMGTPQFAADVLEELARVHDVVAVYTQPDAIRGRGKKLAPSPVKSVAEELGLPVFETKTLRSSEVQQAIADEAPDVICVAAYGAILPREVLEIPRLGCLNVHASLLPRWRGAAPIERAILAGDEEVGVCIMQMEEGLDTGDYCVSRSIPVGNRNAEELVSELADLGARALITALEHIDAGAARWTAQDDAKATYANKIEKRELFLNPALSAEQNRRKVAASSDAHPAKCTICGKTVRVLRAAASDEESDSKISSGVVRFANKHLLLGCADGSLDVFELKPDGKREMNAIDFAAGCPSLRSEDARWEKVDGQ